MFPNMSLPAKHLQTSTGLYQLLRGPGNQADVMFTTDPFAEADEDTGETKNNQNYIHIRIQRMCLPCALHTAMTLVLNICYTERNGRKTLTTVQGLPKKFDQKKILKVIKKKFGKPPSLTGVAQYTC